MKLVGESCRICRSQTRKILDLGSAPPANSLKERASDVQTAYPLILDWCQTCHNVQLRDTLVSEVLYRDYLYVTPRSSTLRAHYEYLLSYLLANGYVSETSFVVEAGSNAGHFLEYLKPAVSGILGVDPAERICAAANDAGIPTVCDFFSPTSAEAILSAHGPADLVVARHCMAHNESPHAMMAAASVLLASDGHLLIENAYILNTIENGEFDQVYHEHMFYYSILSMRALLALHGMHLVDVLMSLVHGGSIIFVAAPGLGGTITGAIEAYESRERQMLTANAFARFAKRAEETKVRLADLVVSLVADGRSVYSYGATAKGNTLLNYVSLTSELIPYCADSTPMKQGLFLPGSSIEVISEEAALNDPPDYFLLTAWNYQDEIITKVRSAGNYHSKFIVPIPFVRVL